MGNVNTLPQHQQLPTTATPIPTTPTTTTTTTTIPTTPTTTTSTTQIQPVPRLVSSLKDRKNALDQAVCLRKKQATTLALEQTVETLNKWFDADSYAGISAAIQALQPEASPLRHPTVELLHKLLLLLAATPQNEAVCPHQFSLAMRSSDLLLRLLYAAHGDLLPFLFKGPLMASFAALLPGLFRNVSALQLDPEDDLTYQAVGVMVHMISTVKQWFEPDKYIPHAVAAAAQTHFLAHVCGWIESADLDPKYTAAHLECFRLTCYNLSTIIESTQNFAVSHTNTRAILQHMHVQLFAVERLLSLTIQLDGGPDYDFPKTAISCVYPLPSKDARSPVKPEPSMLSTVRVYTCVTVASQLQAPLLDPIHFAQLARRLWNILLPSGMKAFQELTGKVLDGWVVGLMAFSTCAAFLNAGRMAQAQNINGLEDRLLYEFFSHVDERGETLALL